MERLEKWVQHFREEAMRFGKASANGRDYAEISDILKNHEKIRGIIGDNYDLDRLRELVEADRDGRCVVLPCKVGTTIYRIEYVQGSDGFEIGIKEHKFDYLFFAFERENIGETIFFDRESAEEALKRRGR